MNIIIVGCSQLGAWLGKILHSLGHSIAMVDRTDAAFYNLPDEFSGLTVTGVPFDDEVLSKAGAENCDILISCGNDDNVNIVVSQIAKKVFNIKSVITVIDNPEREKAYEDFGLASICPSRLTASHILQMIFKNSDVGKVSFGNHTINFDIRADKSFYGRQPNDIATVEEETVFAVIRASGELQFAANNAEPLESGDSLVIAKIID